MEQLSVRDLEVKGRRVLVRVDFNVSIEEVDGNLRIMMERELRYLKDELVNPDRPFRVILGGSKVSDKIAVIKALRERNCPESRL
jgi:3-phosphoglycerate kinase